MADVKSDPKKQRHGRSPAYPSISLEKALVQARALYSAEGKYAAPLSSAFSAWGYSPKSSGGRQALASIRYFGLIDVEGEGDNRKVKVSEPALRYLLDEREDDSDRKALLRRFGLAPSIHQDLATQFPEGIKSDASAKHFLMFECGFNESGAAELLEQFKATAAFANLFKPATSLDSKVPETGNPDRGPTMQQAELADEIHPNPAATQGVRPGAIPASAVERDEEVWMRGPLSGQTRYKIVVDGQMGPREIGKLIKILEAQKVVLEDDED